MNRIWSWLFKIVRPRITSRQETMDDLKLILGPGVDIDALAATAAQQASTEISQADSAIRSLDQADREAYQAYLEKLAANKRKRLTEQSKSQDGKRKALAARRIASNKAKKS